MIMMASVMQDMQRSFQIAKGGRAADQAKGNAEEGLELGLLRENRTKEEFERVINAIGKTTKNPNALAQYNENGMLDLGNGNSVTFRVSDNIGEGGGEVCRDPNVTSTAFTTTKDMEKCTVPADRYFVYPFPGTGTHGGTACDTKKQPHIFNEQWYRDAYFYLKGSPFTGKSLMELASSGDYSKPKSKWNDSDVASYIKKKLGPLDHPCLWNRLSPGVGAEVPLYNKDVGMEALSDFIVRVRTPCKEGILCETQPGKERMDVAAKNSEKNDLALTWDITGTCIKKEDSDGDVCFVSGFDLKTLNTKKAEPGTKITEAKYKSYLPSLSAMIKQLLQYDDTNNYFSNLPSSLRNIVLGRKNGKDGAQGKDIYVLGSRGESSISTLIEFLKSGTGEGGPWKDVSVSKPLLHLSLAATLKTSKGTEIPYVEYQILYKTNDSKKPIITNPVVISSGTSGGYTINMETSVTKQTGTFGYAVVGQ